MTLLIEEREEIWLSPKAHPNQISVFNYGTETMTVRGDNSAPSLWKICERALV